MKHWLLTNLLFFFCGGCSAHGDENLATICRKVCTVLHVENLLTTIQLEPCTDDISKTVISNGNTNIIYINQNQINKLANDSATQEFIEEFCIAHEIQHIISAHNVDPKTAGTRYGSFMEELTCDRFAGYALAILNSTEQSSIIDAELPLVMTEMEKSNTHPPVMARVMAAKAGWMTAMLDHFIDFDSAREMYSLYRKNKNNSRLQYLPDGYEFLERNRMLIQVETLADNRLDFKLLDLTKELIEYVEAPPKEKDIVKDGKYAEDVTGDNSMANFYEMGNDVSLYASANFIYELNPLEEFRTTTIIYKHAGVKYSLIYMGNTIVFTGANGQKITVHNEEKFEKYK